MLPDNSQYLLTDIGLVKIIEELRAIQDDFEELELLLAKRELENKNEATNWNQIRMYSTTIKWFRLCDLYCTD